MSEIENPVEMGRAIIDGHWYMTLATADASGKPWASPVWFAHDGYRESRPSSSSSTPPTAASRSPSADSVLGQAG